jgi:FKBP-type peptidyl-prolyl cis-trans isomerase 2
MAKKKTTKKTTKKKAAPKKAVEKKTAKKVTIKTSHLVIAGLAIAIIAVLGAYFWMGGPMPAVGETVEQMDHVYVTYNGTLANGSVFDAGEIDFDVGAGQMIPCFEEGVIGMALNEEKTIECPPDTAYGVYDTSKVEELDRKIELNRVFSTNRSILEQFTNESVTQGASLAVKGVEWPMTVVSVVGDNVTLKHEPTLGETYYPVDQPTFVVFDLTEDKVILQYQFEVGDSMPTPMGWGTIIDLTEDKVKMDFNHPLAGKTLTFKVTVTQIVKSDTGSPTGINVIGGEEEENETEEEVTGFSPETFDEMPGKEVCTIDGKPVIRLFSTTWCGHCKWIKSTFDSVAQEYVDAGKIVAHHWELDIGDDTLTDAVETEVPASEDAIYKEFNPKGTIPTFVFGCKYHRVGNGYEQTDDLAAEEAEFRAIIEELLG